MSLNTTSLQMEDIIQCGLRLEGFVSIKHKIYWLQTQILKIDC